MYTIHKELFIYTTLNICKQKHVFLYEDSSNKTVKITTNMNCLQKCSKEFINKAVIIQVQVLYIIVFVFFENFTSKFVHIFPGFDVDCT